MSGTTGVQPSGDATGESGGRGEKVFGRLKRVATGAPPPLPPEPPTVVDPVTGLMARVHLRGCVERAIRRSAPTSSRVVVAFVSVGLLRDVNDTFGADRGDELLRAVAQRLSSIDMPGTQVLRYEGAELAVVLEHLNHANANEEIAGYLVELLAEPFAIGDDLVTIVPTVGTAISADNYAYVDELISDAHRSLAHARDEGLHWEVHDESRRGRYETRIDEARLRKALDDHEFVLHYQPIVVADTGGLVGFEALLRWLAPGATNAGVLHPRHFVPLLEKSGLSVGVSRWVLAEACRQIATWNSQRAGEPLFVNVNISPRHLADVSFADDVLSAVRAAGIPPEWLCLDVTESALRFNGIDSWPRLRQLTDAGIRLALDDFGTGVASLHWLLELAVDFIRVDRTFVTLLGTNVRNAERGIADPVAVVVGHLTTMAGDLGIQVIAEGIEGVDELTAARRLGIPLAQGYHYGHAEPAAMASDRVAASSAGSTAF